MGWSCWMWSVSDPSGLLVTPSEVLPIENRSISLGMNNMVSSYMARFQHAGDGRCLTGFEVQDVGVAPVERLVVGVGC